MQKKRAMQKYRSQFVIDRCETHVQDKFLHLFLWRVFMLFDYFAMYLLSTDAIYNQIPIELIFRKVCWIQVVLEIKEISSRYLSTISFQAHISFYRTFGWIHTYIFCHDILFASFQTITDWLGKTTSYFQPFQYPRTHTFDGAYHDDHVKNWFFV